MEKKIELRGIYENNLKHINLDISKKKIIVFTGISGSGKSSILFDTIAVEAQRQLHELFPSYVRKRLPKYERPKGDSIENLSAAVIVDQQPIHRSIRSTVGTLIDVNPMIRLLFSRIGEPSAGIASMYSFNNPKGMCPGCSGTGKQVQLDLDKFIDKNKSLNEGAIQFSPIGVGTWQWKIYANSGLFDVGKPLKNYTDEELNSLLYKGGPKVLVNGEWLTHDGLVDRFIRLWVNRDISKLKPKIQNEVKFLLKKNNCSICDGQRLNKQALSSKINGLSIGDYMDLEITDLVVVLKGIDSKIGKSLAGAILKIINRMSEIGLSYLSLGRSSESLSGGEGQRIKLVKHLGSSLTDMMYILDEPSVGLHPQDIHRLNKLLMQLRDKGNTVLVVEHERAVIAIADEVIDIGPYAGTEGGKVVFQGKYADLLESNTMTGLALRSIPTLNNMPRTKKESLQIKGGEVHNLKKIEVSIPRGALTVISGVAGSGKSTFLMELFLKQYPESIVIDQNLIGATSRSTPATYTGIMTDIRKVFADTNQVRVGLFSFNSEGACPLCKGKGEIFPDMVFADPIAITCEQCQGNRYNKEVLSKYLYEGKNIAEVLDMTISQATKFFEQTTIKNKLNLLEEVGLGYLTLGQPVSTLSGGEKQRIKLASELHRMGNTYIMDEPSTGLHVTDVNKLLNLIQHMVQRGNTIVVAEHHLDIIAAADWIIDLGPGGGKNGGDIMFMGTPQEIIQSDLSITGSYLKQIFDSNI
ncbi:excinuclease ABC subunit A [Enterococcus termitis]|nr:excinuclease ABC subunit A [Enterococcus termitis]